MPRDLKLAVSIRVMLEFERSLLTMYKNSYESQSELCWSLRDYKINYYGEDKMSQSEFCWSLRDQLLTIK